MRKAGRLLVLASVIAVSASGMSGVRRAAHAAGTLEIAEFQPFTGADASFGPEMVAGCDPAVYLINKAGGVLGQSVKCTAVDTRGDPADAVPAVQQLVATASNLVGTLGPSSDEALATLPLFQRVHIPSFVDSGQAALDHSSDPYMWRILPADDVKGYAMAVWARKQGFNRAAVMFGNDIGSQGVVPTLTRGFTKLGGTVAINEQLVLDQSSYRTEIERMLQAKPQVILTEMDPQSSATFLAQLQQLHGMTIPVISTEIALQAPWYQAVSRAIGKTTTAKLITGVQYYTPTAGPSWRIYDAALKPSGHKESDWGNDPYTMSYYDSVNLLCLAMVAAKSTNPAVFNRYIATVTTGTVKVNSFVEGKQALASGKSIRYIGAAGPVEFNQFHNSVGTFEAARYDAKGNITQAGVLSQSAITALTR